MMKFLILLLISFSAMAQSPWYYGTGTAVNLTNGIQYSNGVQVLSGSVDPSSSAVSAPQGSVYISTIGTTFVKQDSGSSTNWIPLGIAGVTSVNGLLGPSLSIVSGSAGSDFGVSSSGSTITLDLPDASSSSRGALSSSDWSLFNSKEPSITAGTTGQYWRGDKAWATLDTSIVPENGNLYYTSSRFNTDFSGKSTSDLAEGAYLYFTESRTRSTPLTGLSTGTISAVTSADSVLVGVGKLQAQVTQNASDISGKEPAITVLPLSKGGSNKNITPASGGVLYTDADSFEVTSVGTSGQVLQSNGSSAPSWVNKSISGKAGSASSVTVEEIQTGSNQLTETATNKHKVETENNNLLQNPRFDHKDTAISAVTSGSSSSAGWTVTQTGTATCTLTQETTGKRDEHAHYAKLAASGGASGGTCSLKQSVTTTVAANAVMGFWYRSDPLGVCPEGNPTAIVQTTRNGSASLTKEATECGTSSTWEPFFRNDVTGTTSSGVETVITVPASTSTNIHIAGAKVSPGELASAPIITSWQSYTPTFTGFGTVTCSNCIEWMQFGPNIILRGTFSSGTPATSTEGRMSLPNSFTTPSISSSTQNVGTWGKGSSATSHGSFVLIESSKSYITFSTGAFSSNSANALAKTNTDNMVGSGDPVGVLAIIPIANLQGSTNVITSECGTECREEFSAKVDSSGNISDPNVPGWLASCGFATNPGRYSCTFKGSLFSVNPNCTVQAFGTDQTVDAKPQTISTTTLTYSTQAFNVSSPYYFNQSVIIRCSKHGVDALNARLLTASLKNTPKYPGVILPKKCLIIFGGSGSLSSPANCGGSPCTMYYDSCGGASVTRSSTGDYRPTWPSGTWAASTPIFCDQPRGAGGVAIAITGGTDFLISNASGGYSARVYTENATGSLGAVDSYAQFSCSGESP